MKRRAPSSLPLFHRDQGSSVDEDGAVGICVIVKKPRVKQGPADRLEVFESLRTIQP